VLKYSTRRGIQTSPAISLIGKALANIEGSVRYIAPELMVMEVFEEVFQDLAFDLVAEAASEETAAKLIMDALIAMSASPEQARSLLRDFANREVTVQINSRRYPLLGEDPALRLLVALAAGKILLRRKSA
jgi:ubiquinone biosynthesis protein